ncbi:ribonuclease 1, partial [Phtheirospermum japonicum]
LSKVEKQLAHSWPSIRRDLTNRQFWQYQWDKHGTCVLPRMNVLNYLQLIITQQRKFDLLRALATNNIKPNGSSYSRKNVETAIRQGIGGNNFYISCQSFKSGAFIREVYICLDSSGHKVISCPSNNHQRGCGRNKNLVLSAAATRI